MCFLFLSSLVSFYVHYTSPKEMIKNEEERERERLGRENRERERDREREREMKKNRREREMYRVVEEGDI